MLEEPKIISDKESLFFYLPLKLNELSINDLEQGAESGINYPVILPI